MILLGAVGVVSEMIAHAIPPSPDTRMGLPKKNVDNLEKELDRIYDKAKEEIRRMR